MEIMFSDVDFFMYTFGVNRVISIMLLILASSKSVSENTETDTGILRASSSTLWAVTVRV